MFVNLGPKKCRRCPQKKILCMKECTAQEAKQSSAQASVIFLSGSGSQLNIRYFQAHPQVLAMGTTTVCSQPNHSWSLQVSICMLNVLLMGFSITKSNLTF